MYVYMSNFSIFSQFPFLNSYEIISKLNLSSLFNLSLSFDFGVYFRVWDDVFQLMIGKIQKYTFFYVYFPKYERSWKV